MKYSNIIGSVAALAVMASCFFPWVYIPAIQTVVTGLKSGATNFGKPGLFNIILSAVAIVCFLVPRVGAKRVNIFICALNFAWAIRNLLLLGTCEMGECPEKKIALYLLVLFAAIMLVMGLFPNIRIAKTNTATSP